MGNIHSFIKLEEGWMTNVPKTLRVILKINKLVVVWLVHKLGRGNCTWINLNIMQETEPKTTGISNKDKL